MGLFGVGQRPTGDKDPFALRRHALGVIRIVIERKLMLPAHTLVNTAFSAFPLGFSDAGTDVLHFMSERLEGYCRDLGYSSTEVDAVVGAGRWVGLSAVPKMLSAVRAFSQLSEAPALAAANKRIGNILKKTDAVDPHVSEVLLKEPAEIALHAALKEIGPKANALFDAGDYTASLQSLAALRAPVDAFFEDVMVNAEQMDLRINRLGLLTSLHAAMNRVADLSRLAA